MKLNHVIVVLVIALAAAVLHGTEAKKYQVGGDLGWTIPPGGASTYASWASKHTLKVDKDTLVFNFKAGENDSTIVTKENYDSCNTKDPLYQIKSPGVVVVAAAMLQGTEAKKYRVGGNLGWTIPPGGAATYSSWASKYTFKVNKDLLARVQLRSRRK
uniref:early nodulin-like protein 2 n=1 Tax=Fragaria vesca subsp. vesca TaxID=101020 RepID=UPI0005CB0023|nr:PREDICTED: early nodulin-like protein 2 [Fragaria vesca subsp. vesca]